MIIMINPAMDARKDRMAQVKEMLEKMLPCQYHKALAIIQINTGLRKETAKEYINAIMVFNDLVVNSDGVIVKLPLDPLKDMKLPPDLIK